MRTEMRRLIEARIDRLPDAFRVVFMLRAVEEMSVEEVAAALEMPEATVRTRFFRARSLLREGLSRDVDLALDDAFSFAGERCDRIVAGVLGAARRRKSAAARAPEARTSPPGGEGLFGAQPQWPLRAGAVPLAVEWRILSV